MHIAVVGAGYVGLVVGTCLAQTRKHRVTLVERDAERVQQLREGRLPVSEPGLAEAFSVRGNSIRVVQAVSELDGADLVFITVGTPIDDDGELDLRQLFDVADELSAYPDLHVSVRSTLPPGFSAKLPSLFGRLDASRLSTNPEFLRQGSAVADFLRPTRIVVGRFPDTSPEHLALLDAAYQSVTAPKLTVPVTVAELIKNVSNAFLALRLSFVNEVASLAEEFGAEALDVLDGVGLDPRIGSEYMRPSLGLGGSCLPKELRVLAAAGQTVGLPMHIAAAASLADREHRDRFARQVCTELPERGQVGLLGLSFKGGTDDLRGSPSVHLARSLIAAGHRVVAFDPAVPATHARAAISGIEIASEAVDVFRDADAVVVGTDWPVFGELDLARAAGLMCRPLLFDGRAVIDRDAAAAAGLVYRGVGHPRDRSATARMAGRK